MSHAYARLTVRGRLLIVERRRQGWRQAHIAAAMGVSRTCVRHWLHRFATEGEAGLADRSSRPHHSPTKTSPEVEARSWRCVRPSSAGGTRSLPRPASRPGHPTPPPSPQRPTPDQQAVTKLPAGYT